MTAYATGGSTAGGGSFFELVFPFVLMILVFYFLLIRPQKKQQKAIRNMLDNLKVNDKVITVGGVMGKVVQIKDDDVIIQTGPEGAKIKFQKAAIGKVLTTHDNN